MTTPAIFVCVLVVVFALGIAIGYAWGISIGEARNMRKVNNILNKLKNRGF